MGPGRELDALIAEKVMGCKLAKREDLLKTDINQTEYEFIRKHKPEFWCDCVDKTHEQTDDYGIGYWLKQYSTDIKAAWEVVEKMKELAIAVDPYDKSPYCTEPWNTFATTLSNLHDEHFQRAFWNVSPLNICLAALKAKGIAV